MDNLIQTNRYFSYINNLTKYSVGNSDQQILDRYSKVKTYLDTLSLDKRKNAVGFDIYIWLFEMFGTESSKWSQALSSNYGDGFQEQVFLLKNPSTALITNTAFNVNFSKLVNDRASLSVLNGIQLDLFEHLLKDEFTGWDYNVVTKQQAEAAEAGPFDFISLYSFDVVHNPEVVKSYYQMLNPGGVLLISFMNDNGNVYENGAEYSPYTEICEQLKSIDGSLLYHDYTTIGTSVAIKM